MRTLQGWLVISTFAAHTVMVVKQNCDSSGCSLIKANALYSLLFISFTPLNDSCVDVAGSVREWNETSQYRET